MTQDVTERTEALLAARESSEQYRALLENMLEGFAYCRMVYDDEGRPDDFIYLSVNPAFYRLTGLEDAVGKRVTELLPGIKESNPELFELYGRVAATGEPAEFDIDFVPIQRWLHVSATRPREDEFVAFFSDVTERKEAERLAAENDERLHSSLRAAAAAVWDWDIASGAVAWSDEAWDLYGLERDGRDTSYGLSIETIHPDDRAAVAAVAERGARDGVELLVEWRVNTSDGSERWLLSRGRPELDAEGVVTRYHGVVLDVTDRRVAEHHARDSEARLRLSLAAADAGTWEWDLGTDENLVRRALGPVRPARGRAPGELRCVARVGPSRRPRGDGVGAFRGRRRGPRAELLVASEHPGWVSALAALTRQPRA